MADDLDRSSLCDRETEAAARQGVTKGEPESAKPTAPHSDASDDLRELDLPRTAVGLAKPRDAAPAYVSFKPYEMTAKGLSVEVEKGKGENKTTEKVWIAAPFEVLGACRDPRGRAWGNMLRWRDADGHQHQRHVADADLHGEPAALCAALANEGLRIVPRHQRELRDYLAAVRVRRRITVVERTGWHEIGGRSVFVVSDHTIGARGTEPVVLSGAASGPYERRGNLDQWRKGVAKLASGNVVLVLAISAAFAGPLLGLGGYDGGGFHFRGRSSTGKTTALRLAASVWGRGDTPGFVRAWRATTNGREAVAASATDTVLIFDELGQIEAHDFATGLYLLANGGGKSRAHRDGSLREPQTWRLLFLSSGEISLEAKLVEERGRKPRAGQLVRMLDIPAERAFGVFDSAGPSGNAADLAEAGRIAAASTYGTAGLEFVRRLIADKVTGDDVRSMVDDFVAATVPSGADGQVGRAAKRFGIVAAAGEMAIAFGLTGWREGEAREAAAWALKKWVEARGGIEPIEVRQAIEAVRHFIEVHGEARFDSLDDRDARAVANRAGWRKGVGEDRRWLIPPEVWKREVCAGFDPKLAASELAKIGALIKGSDGNTRVERIADTTKRVYVVTPRIFEGAEE